jgi:YegS/Rv2252/BmrU family lipid kinase
MKSPVILIANPVAKRASEQKIQKAATLLRSAGHEVHVRLTQKRGDAEGWAREAAKDGAPLIIAAGGDGTFNEVINGIANTGTAMAIVPLGTTNVLAKELGVPENAAGAIDIALQGKVHSVSLGRVVCVSRSSPFSRYFCLMAGIGFDGEAVYGVSGSLKRHSGKCAYILSGLKTLMRYSPGDLRFTVNETAYAGYSAVVGNASRYGGNFKITPDAMLQDPHLYIAVMHGKRRRDIMRYIYGIFRGRHLLLKDITYLRGDMIRIEGIARIQIDGDYFGTTPATITVVPDALQLIH